MITIENVETCGWEPALRGMRNPKNSWSRSDTLFFNTSQGHIQKLTDPCAPYEFLEFMELGPNDLALSTTLALAGPVHAKYRRMIKVYCDITAPLYWWKEFDTYKVGTNANSCSTMHTIHKRDLTLDDFAHDRLTECNRNLLELVIKNINEARREFVEAATAADAKEAWWQMIQLLPSSFLQRRTVEMNYEVLSNMYSFRKNHKQDEWREFCRWIETLPYAKELILT